DVALTGTLRARGSGRPGRKRKCENRRRDLRRVVDTVHAVDARPEPNPCPSFGSPGERHLLERLAGDAPARLVPGKETESAVAQDHGPVRDPRLGGHGAADAGRARRPALAP